jgi:hypothetical protein
LDCGRIPGVGPNGRHTGKRHTQRHRHTRHRDIPIGGVSDDICHPDRGYSSKLGHGDEWLGDRVHRRRLINGWGLGQPTEHDLVLSR